MLSKITFLYFIENSKVFCKVGYYESEFLSARIQKSQGLSITSFWTNKAPQLDREGYFSSLGLGHDVRKKLFKNI